VYKLLQICVEGNTGSTGTIAESIGLQAIQKGWESYIAYGRNSRQSKSKLIRIGTDWDTRFHALETRIFDNHGLGSRCATTKLINKIKNIQPDIIHLHHLHGYYINIVILFKFLSKSKIPVVWTFHDCWSFTGHCTYFDFVGCDKWKTECNNCPQKNEYPKSIFLDNSRQNFNLKKALFTSISNLTIVSVSNWLNNLVAQSFFKNSNHICIYNGIDLETFKPLDSPHEVKVKYKIENKFVLLGAATIWDRRKGLSDFIKLSQYLKQDEVIILVGLDKIQIKNLPPNIIGLSRTDNRNELANLFGAADVFLNLSVEETFGLTTAESMACGTPVIVYNKTASPELVTENTGFVVEKDDILAVINAIKNIKKNKKSFYKTECRKRAIEKFNSIDNFKAYMDLYEKIIIN
jgi:putative colanic acid biosynthesis glycosyltransferase